VGVADTSQEKEKRSVKLPESERTIGAMLDETYETYKSTTGSLFTGFVLRSDMEKERVLNDLLDLFVASDKVWAITGLITAVLISVTA
jgi:histone acetyltransferase HTATIP